MLCIGNYYRAKRAMERQKQKRLARLSGRSGNGVIGMDSPSGSTASSHMSEEKQQLLGNMGQNATMKQQTARRRNMDENGESLLLDVDDTGPRAQVSAV